MKRSAVQIALLGSILLLGVAPSISYSQIPARPASPPAYIVKVAPAKSDGVKLEPLASLYSHGNPTAEEQWLLERINWARAHPDSEGIRLATVADQYVSTDYTQWGTPTRQQVRSDFATYRVMPPLAFNADLIAAATGHSHKMLEVDSMYHVGPDGTPWERMQNAGYVSTGYSGENVGAYDRDLEEDFDGFQIDFGNPGLGHRLNDMNFDPAGPYYTEVGIGVIPGGSGYPNVGPIITTEDFGDAGKKFILGVAYTDNNHNRFYDIGEGDSGVKITVSNGSYYAVTSGSGGYAIPYSGSGTVTVTASGGAFPVPVTKTISIDTANVKVDFNPDLTGFPTLATLLIPESNGVVNYDSATFVWNTVALANSYHIEIGTDSLFKQKLLVNDSGLKDTAFIFGVFKDSSTYYWRVQAKNSKGVGPWSTAAEFSSALVPSTITLVAPANTAIVPDSTVVFEWNAANREATVYQLNVASDKAMTHIIWDTTIPVTFGGVRAAASHFESGKTYYWDVLAQNDNGWSKPSAVRNFTVSSAGVDPTDVAQGITLIISPNPTADIVHIRYTLASVDEVSFRLFNALGQVVRSVRLGTLPAGPSEYDFEVSSLAPGTYTVELLVGGRLELGRVVIRQ